MVKVEKETKIGVNFNGSMTICSITKYTTCDDVIEMVMYSFTQQNRALQYGLFETSKGVERMLKGSSSTLKVVRSWGSRKEDVSLVVKPVNCVVKKKIKMSKAKKKLEKIRSLLAINKAEAVTHNTTIQNNLEGNTIDKMSYKKCLKLDNDPAPIDNTGKLNLLKRYLNDVANTAVNTLDVTYLGTTDVEDISSTCSSLYDECDSDLDTAFIGVHCDMLEMTVDVTANRTTDQLNTCMFIDEDSSDAESAFYDTCSNSELERNVFEVSDHDVDEFSKVRSLFEQMGHSDSCSYDRAMESFMDSLVGRHDNDEGLGSSASDI